MRARVLARISTAFVVGLLLVSELSWGQGNLGGISGHVVDSSGAAVPGASVRITKADTGTVTEVSSTGEGDYVATGLNPGTYEVSVAKPGFATAIQSSVVVSTATTSTVNITLNPGSSTQVVSVTASEQQLNTDNAEVGTVLPQKEMLDLPISLGGAATTGASGRRQIENFTFLTPGVTGNQWEKQINGAPGFSQEILYDGGDAQSIGAPGFIAESSPPYEAISEFKVQNTQYPAEYGFGMGVENFTFRSGTNQFHGDLFEFLRNDILDAKGFFSTTKAPLRQNEFGGTVGGPVILPHYDGKNKTFFFFAYDGFRLAGGLPYAGTVTIPSLQERSGNFSDYPLPIYDPATTTQLPDGTFVRTAFPGNMIPADRISPIATKLMGLLPKPDFSTWNNNYLNRQNQPTTEDSYSARIDHFFNESNHLSGSFWWTHGTTLVNGALAGNALDQNRVTETNGGGVRVNYTRVLSPTLINNATFGFTPVTPTWANWLADPIKGNSMLQIPGISQAAPGFPTFDFTGTNYLALGNSTNQGATPQHFENWSANDSVSWIRGIHQVGFGINFRHRTMHTGDLRNSAGTLSISNLSTSNPNDPNYGQYGNALATLLLGQIYSGSVTTPERAQTFSDTFLALYAEDTIKATQRLTFNLGLRYELPFYPSAGGGGDLSSVLLDLPNPGAGGIPGALRFSGKAPGASGTFNVLYKNYRTAFSPRLGVTYQLTKGTVLRAGYGMFYVYPNYGRLNSGALWGNGFGYTQALATTNQGITPAFDLDTGFPPSNITLPNTDPSLLNGGTASYINTHSYEPSKQQSWTFDIQQSLPLRVTLDLAYVGAHTIRLEGGLENVNQVNPQYLSLGNLLTQQVNSPQAIAAGIKLPYSGFTGSVAQALRPFPQYTTLNDVYQPTGNADYNALQMRLQKSFGGGLTFLVSYTFSKTHGLVSGDTYGDPSGSGGVGSLNTYNLRGEESISPYDQTHVLSISSTYELPIGRGKTLGNGISPVLNQVIGGWQINGIASYSSGLAIAVSGGTPLPLFGGVGNRPDLISPSVGTNQPIYNPSTDPYLNRAAFADPAPFTFGNAPPRLPNVRNPFNYDEAISIFKKFPIRESSYLEFRTEMFDAFNRVVFGGMDANIDDPNFGHFTGQQNTPRVIQGALKFIF